MLLYHSLALFLSAAVLPGPADAARRDPKAAPSSTASSTSTSTPTPSPPPDPCTIRSPHTGSFFDLNSLNIPIPESLPDKTRPKNARDYSYNATGWDMGYNFTMNFCGPVVEDLHKLGGVVGVDTELYRNVSAYYRYEGKVVSIGQVNTSPVIRGRKMVLNYTDGSPCDSSSSRSRGLNNLDLSSENTREIISPGGSSNTTRRKSTIISMLCDRDPLSPHLTLNFVAAAEDECTYFFEARTFAACPTIEQRVQTLSPSGVFGVIAAIAIIVYLVGGCVYSRMVLQQRGWRQVPNYALWAGMLSFLRDLLIILASSCLRCLPFRRSGGGSSNAGFGSSANGGYSRSNGGMNGGLSGLSRGGRDSDAENRLIDELNEEWED